MKFKVLFMIVALLMLMNLGFCQAFEYPGDWDYTNHLPLSFGGDCWVGDPIPNGTPIVVYVDDIPTDTVFINADQICNTLSGGFFFFEYYLLGLDGTINLDIMYENCHYRTHDFSSGDFELHSLDELDWDCACAPPDVVIIINGGNAVLHWNPVGVAPVYSVYGADEPFIAGDFLDSVTNTTWTDTDTPTRPSPYFYYVTATE